jgi:hypothetical protein
MIFQNLFSINHTTGKTLFGRRPPPVGVSCCRTGIHGVAPTVRQQDTPTGGSAVQKENRLCYAIRRAGNSSG